MFVKRGDNVKILVGKDKGKTGKVIRSIPREEKIVVEGINIAKNHTRPKREGEKGEIVEFPRPIHVSNVKKRK